MLSQRSVKYTWHSTSEFPKGCHPLDLSWSVPCRTQERLGILPIPQVRKQAFERLCTHQEHGPFPASATLLSFTHHPFSLVLKLIPLSS